MKQRLVVIGNNMARTRAVGQLRPINVNNCTEKAPISVAARILGFVSVFRASFLPI
jgi:hypothetical protein